MSLNHVSFLQHLLLWLFYIVCKCFYSLGFCLCADIEEKGVRMKLTVIDTPGFGDQINNENWYVSVCHCMNYVNCEI